MFKTPNFLKTSDEDEQKVEFRHVKTALCESWMKIEDKGYEYVSVTEWINGDGVDVTVSRRNEPEIRFCLNTDEIIALRKCLRRIM